MPDRSASPATVSRWAFRGCIPTVRKELLSCLLVGAACIPIPWLLGGRSALPMALVLAVTFAGGRFAARRVLHAGKQVDIDDRVTMQSSQREDPGPGASDAPR